MASPEGQYGTEEKSAAELVAEQADKSPVGRYILGQQGSPRPETQRPNPAAVADEGISEPERQHGHEGAIHRYLKGELHRDRVTGDPEAQATPITDQEQPGEQQ